MAAVDVGIQLALTLHRLYPADYPLARLQPLLRDAKTVEAIKAGKSLQAIRELWTADLEQFRLRRSRYLLYPQSK
jgi:hypothetical protein